MQIILIKDVDNLGYANDIVEAKPGYANNFLIPQGFAKVATVTARKILAENLRQRAHKDAKIEADAQTLADKIANLPLVFKVKASASGKIFGSITTQMIADAMTAKGVELEKKNITVEGFKIVGAYQAEVRLHKLVKGIINFTIESENEIVKEEKSEAAPAKKEKKSKAVEENVAKKVASDVVEAPAKAVVEAPAETATELPTAE